MPYYCSAHLAACPRATRSSHPLMGLWQLCRPPLFPWQLPPRLLEPDLRRVSATPKRSAFCHVLQKMLLGSPLCRLMGSYDQPPVYSVWFCEILVSDWYKGRPRLGSGCQTAVVIGGGRVPKCKMGKWRLKRTETCDWSQTCRQWEMFGLFVFYINEKMSLGWN